MRARGRTAVSAVLIVVCSCLSSALGDVTLWTPPAAADTVGATWTELSPSTSPPDLADASMAYDPATGQLVLFGGHDDTLGVYPGETWTWDGSTWTELSPATSPPARSDASMAYDPATGQLLLIGGYGPGVSHYADTWSWNGSTWTQLSPATSPPERYDASMAYDPGTGQLVLFGGAGDSAALSDTWTWNGSTWTQLSPAKSPPARSDGSMSYDPGTGQLVLFGGLPNSGPLLSDTWTWNGSTWTKLSPSTSPPAVFRASMAYDPGTGQLVLFGGRNGNGANTSNTWSWNGSTWTELSPSASPPGRAFASMAYDPGTGQLVLFGGNQGLADTWIWGYPTGAVTEWTALSPATNPPARSGASMTYDPGTGQLVLFGGNDGTGPLADTWTWNGSTWTALSPATSPPARSGASMTYDPGTGQLVLFGGNDGTGNFDGDTWSLAWVAPQSITFLSTAPTSGSYSGSNNQTYLVSATASSGLPVTLSIDPSSTAGCTIAAATVSYGAGIGTCTIDATQAGDANYFAAAELQQSFTVGQGPQSISFSSTTPTSPTYSGSNDHTYLVSATASSGLPVRLSIDPSSTSGCTISASTVSYGRRRGTCLIDATQAGDANYLAAAEVQQAFTIVGPTPPAGYVGVSINSGNYATDSHAVNLDLVWPAGATSAVISNDGGFNETGGTEVTALSPVVPWTLENTGFNGLPEDVYVRFLGAAIDTTTFSDGIVMDEAVPNISTANLIGASSSATPNILATPSYRGASSSLHQYSIRINASDRFSGVSKVAVASTTANGTTITLTSPKSKGLLTLARTFTVSLQGTPSRVRVRSAAGKWSRWLAVTPVYRARTVVRVSWTATENARLHHVAAYLHVSPAAAQKDAVDLLAYLLARGLKPPKSLTLPAKGNAATYTTVWAPSELGSLNAICRKFSLGAIDATRLSVYVVSYLLALSGR